MTPSIDHASARRILELADAPAARGGSRSRALVIFLLIALLAAHAARSAGFPDSAHSAAMSPAGASSRARESDHMKQLMAIGVAAAMAGSATAQNAVQWRVQDGGNGHWYAWSSWGSFASSASAGSEASRRGAHLVTLTSAAEEAFVQGIAPSGSCQDLGHSEALIGAFQTPGSVEPSSGWRWVTGEAMVYTHWRPGEPNDSGGIENVGYLNRTGGWNDGTDTGLGCAHSAIFEWSADCNADGIVDYGQILAGELEDANANNIPDCCEDGTSCTPCAGDVDESGAVNGVDLAAVLNNWGTNGGKYPRADINGDGTVDASDLAFVLSTWGACP
jgi:hypothetical protein